MSAHQAALAAIHPLAPKVRFMYFNTVWSWKWRKHSWHKGYFRRYGLLCNDQDYDARVSPIFDEAIRRLPQDLQDARMRRLERAVVLSMNNQVLPKDEWTTWEQENWYLEPYVQQVEMEAQRNKNPFIKPAWALENELGDDEHRTFKGDQPFEDAKVMKNF